MSKPIYFYIDDENGSPETSTLNGFNDLGMITVERFPLSEFTDFSKLKSELLKGANENKYDGLIFDLRLDGTGADRTEFNATAITQELRSVAARSEIKSFPIVLCSTEDKIKQTYDTDKTSHDLFDYQISKSNPSPKWAKLSSKLLSLANDYKWLQEDTREKFEILGLDNLQTLDERIVERLECLSNTYDYASFIVNNFFHQTNPLVNEKILAARLGIDLDKTPEIIWKKLQYETLNDIKYKGIFSNGWNRWWADKLSEWFFVKSGERLAFINAEKRVEILKEITGFHDIIAAKPIKFCNSSEFWTICEAYKVPIDPLEGFKIFTTLDLKPWQESKYISLLAVIEREGLTDRGLRPHSIELDRIKYTKELLKAK